MNVIAYRRSRPLSAIDMHRQVGFSVARFPLLALTHPLIRAENQLAGSLCVSPSTDRSQHQTKINPDKD